MEDLNEKEEYKSSFIKPLVSTENTYDYLLKCQEPSGEWIDDSFLDIYLKERPDKKEHSEMLEIVYNTVVALKILKEMFSESEEEWRMVEMKGYVYLKRKHLLDKLAIDRII
jgi:hypothetical protein